jgi:nicotinamide-nucleotide amidase
VPNPHGTAPGIDLDAPRACRAACRIIALPGVPAELFEMWSQTAGPALAAHAGAKRVLCHRRIKCFGVGESDLERMLPDLIRRGRDPSVGITVSEATITLRITAGGASLDECQAHIAPTVDVIRQHLGNLVFGEEEDELEHAVVRMLLERGRTLGTLEFGTHGLLSNWLGEAPGSAGAYRGGVVAGAWPVAARCLGLETGQLGVNELSAAESDAPAVEQTLASLTSRLREALGVDYALAVGPFPEFEPQATEPGHSWFALAGPARTLAGPARTLAGPARTLAGPARTLAGPGEQLSRRIPFTGHPAILKPLAGKRALNLLRLHLLESAE